MTTLLFKLVGARGSLNNMQFRDDVVPMWFSYALMWRRRRLNKRLLRRAGTHKPLNKSLFRRMSCPNACCSASLGQVLPEHVVVQAALHVRVLEQHACQG